MSSHPDRTEALERDLRSAAHDFDAVPVASDAWQQNQRRLAADRGRRARVAVAAAAAVLLVAFVAGAVALVGGTGSGSPPAQGSGSDDPFDSSYQLGPPVELESRQVGGQQVVHEGVLSDMSGKGPSLCDRYVGANGSFGGCTSRDPDADISSVAFDWLSGSEGKGDIRGVLAGVDERVAKVQVWMSNGDETLATLEPGGWAGTRLFAFTAAAGSPVPQRLVAYADASGTVLQSVDLANRFGDAWLPLGTGCNELGAQAPLPGLDARVSGEPGFVDIAMELPGHTARTVCLPMTATAIGAGAGAGPDDVVVVTGPGVSAVRPDGPGSTEGPVRAPGTIWNVWVVHAPAGLHPEDRIDLLDGRNHVLGQLSVAGLS